RRSQPRRIALRVIYHNCQTWDFAYRERKTKKDPNKNP
ncbi:hypothetical protein Pmar_PMAR007066, partial [Perkinsus marinus ATCC 50983]